MMAGDTEQTLEEKLMLIDQEIRTLHKFCLSQGYTPSEVERAAKPLLDCVWEERKKTYLRVLWKGTIFIAAIAALLYYDPAYRMLCSYSKRASIQLLPFVDWTRLYEQDCLIDNPYYRGNDPVEEDCEICEVIDEIDRRQNISQSSVAFDYLKQDVPLIITDGLREWPAMEKFDIHFLSQLYDNEPLLAHAKPCYFACNVRSQVGMVRLLLQGAVKGAYDKWYAHWENCDRHAAKFLRQFMPRPYFLPAMVEISETNWIFISQNYRAKKYKPGDIANSMGLFAQIKGESKIKLAPRTPCEDVCTNLYATLHEGEVLIFTDFMWIMDYLPLGSAQSVAVGMGGFFD